MKKDLFSNLKKLRNVKPDANWKVSHRDILMSQIKAQVVDHKKPLYKVFGLISMQFVKTNTFIFKSGLSVILIVFALFGGSVWTVKASEKSLPGDLFYSFKITKEKMQVSMTGAEVRKTELHIEFAGKRIDEINKVKSLPLAKDVKTAKMKTAISGFKDEINKAKENLTNIDKNVSEPQKVVKVAKFVDEKVEKYKEVLKNGIKKEAALDKDTEVEAEVKDAIKVSKETVDEAVSVMLNQQNKDPNLNEEVKNTVLSKIDKITKDNDELANVISGINTKEENIENKETVGEKKEENTTESAQTDNEQENNENIKENKDGEDQVSTTDTDENSDQTGDKNENSSESSEIKVEPQITNALSELSAKPEEVKVILQEANTLVEQGDLDKAVEKLKESSIMVDEMNDKIEANLNTETATGPTETDAINQTDVIEAQASPETQSETQTSDSEQQEPSVDNETVQTDAKASSAVTP